MKIMKKNLLYMICAICVVCGFCACEDFLDTDNLTMKDTSNFPVNETDAIQTNMAIYSINWYFAIYKFSILFFTFIIFFI